MAKLRDKVAIITGAASGLGQAGAILFASEGAKVVAIDIDDTGLQETIGKIKATGAEAMAYRADVSDLAQMQAMAENVVKTYGQIDILWNNAAVVNALYSSAEEITEDQWNRVIQVNLTGTFFGVKVVVPYMKARKSGVIINTASIAGLVAHMPGRAAYVASKGGIIALTRQLSLELGPHNIRVNAIAPGAIATGMRNRMQKPENPTFDHKPTETPTVDALRPALPIEIARTALFLAGDDLGPMTGVILPHDGGKASR